MTGSTNKSLAIIVPVFNESGSISPFCSALSATFKQLATKTKIIFDIEVIFVNDGSTDNTKEKILQERYYFDIRVINFSRNFGKESAMTAGIRETSADVVVIIDVDMQDPPSLIVEMVSEWLRGAKLVLARRADRSEDFFLKRITSSLFYRLHNQISEIKIPNNVGDFRLMDRQVVDAVNSLDESRRFMKGLFAWVGFDPVYLNYKREPRNFGSSKFSGWKLWRFAVEGITSFSDLPLVIWTYLGAIISMASFLYVGFIVLRTLIFGIEVPGYASLLVGILFMGGIQIIGIGVLGEYLGRVYSEVKRRPQYIIESQNHVSRAKIFD